MVPEWSFWLALGVMLIGLIGALLPAMPGAALIWLAALGYGLSDGFHRLPLPAFVAITVLAAIGMVLEEFITPVARAFYGWYLVQNPPIATDRGYTPVGGGYWGR